MSDLPDKIKEPLEIWVIEFIGGERFICLGLEDVVEQFGPDGYQITKGIWTPQVYEESRDE